MRVLVTGAAGFAGRHLCRELCDAGHTVIATDQQISNPIPDVDLSAPLDISDADAVSALFTENTPEACIHLAAISFVPDGDANPALITNVNVGGTVNILEAAKLCPGCKVLLVSTTQVYGMDAQSSPITEDTPLAPLSAYAESKVAAEQKMREYADKYETPIIIARPGNHTGPGQRSCFVVSSFVKQVKAAAENNTDLSIRVGNMESRRGFTDVRDVVKAYRLLIENGSIGQTYNISSGKIMPIGDVLTEICNIAGVKVTPEVDDTLYRPTDSAPPIDSTRIQKDVGWTAEIPLAQTLTDMLEMGTS